MGYDGQNNRRECCTATVIKKGLYHIGLSYSSATFLQLLTEISLYTDGRNILRDIQNNQNYALRFPRRPLLRRTTFPEDSAAATMHCNGSLAISCLDCEKKITFFSLPGSPLPETAIQKRSKNTDRQETVEFANLILNATDDDNFFCAE